MPKTKIGTASQRALRQIQKQHLSPRPAWQYRLLSLSLWIGVVISLVLGGFSLSLFLFMFRTNDWDLAYIPIFWLFSLFIFWLLSPRLLSKTRYGYRLTSRQFLILNLVTSLILGVFLVRTRLPRLLDITLQQTSPLYSQLAPHKQDFWSQPESGRLSGRVIQVNHSSVDLTDWSGRHWTVILSSETNIRPRVKMVVGEEIKIVGNTQDNSIFEAQEIRPWEGRGERNNAPVLY